MHISILHTFTKITLVALTLLLAPQKGEGAHLIGGDISYKYIGDSTGIPHHYEIQLTLLRTTNFVIINLGHTYQVCTRSSCFPNQTITVSVDSSAPIEGILISEDNLCINKNDSNYITIYKHEYKGDIILPGPCSDYTFSHAMICCRVGLQHIANYSGNGSGGSQNYLEATLNNIFGNNSSPQFLPRSSPYAFCHNQEVYIDQTTVDIDGDSIGYRLELSKNGVCNGPGHNMMLDSAYTIFQPFPTAPGSSLTISNNGVMNFTSGNISGNFIYVIVIEDYRYIPAFNSYIKTGSSYREEWISFADQCLENVQRGPSPNDSTYAFENFPSDILNRLSTPQFVPNADTIYDPNDPTQYQLGLFVVDYNCDSTEIDLHFDLPILCSSLESNGTDFRILSPDSINIPVISAYGNCDSSGYTQHITLKLLQSLPQNGDFLLTIRTGYDNNTLINFCGFEIPPYYTMVLRSTNCPIVSTQTFAENGLQAKLFPNPNTGLFTIVLSEQTSDPHQITLTDLRGVQVLQLPMHASGEMPIDGRSLASGQYIVRIENSKTGAGKNMRLVKQ